MSPREATRRLIDNQNNEYFITVPFDVNLDSIEDILLGMHQGIVKLQGYQLASEGKYRLPDTQETDGRSFKFYKKVNVFTDFPGLDPKDFSEAISDLLAKARKSKIGRAEITTIEGKLIKKDDKGAYIDWAVKCVACGKEIKGRRPVSFSAGYPTRAQMFVPDDPGVTRVKEGSKQRLCSGCAVKTIPLPEVQIGYETAIPVEPVAEVTESIKEAIPAPVVLPEPVSKEKGIVISDSTRKDLEELLAMSKHDSGVGLEYFKGMVYGVVKALLR